MVSSGGTSFRTTPTGMSLFVAYFILVHLFNIGTGTIFLEALEEVILMGGKEGPANHRMAIVID